jgi:hypothetical protein
MNDQKQVRPWVNYALWGAMIVGGAAVHGHLTKPPPSPTPSPAPDHGPNPAPKPKTTQEQLQDKLQAAYDQDKAHANFKAGQKLQLIGLYQSMIDSSKLQDVQTVGQLLADMRTVASKYIGPGSLIEVRQVVAAEAVKSLGLDPAKKMDDATRAASVQLWTNISDALSKVQ